MTWHADYPNTFTGNSTQNVTTDQLGVFVGFIPTYGLRQMWMTETIGSGIIQSIAVSQLCQLFLRRTVGTGCTWASTCAINSFVYTITVVMMGTSSALFNPAVMFGWAILGRTNFKHWIILFLAQTAGAIVGTLCSWSQNIQYLARVPIPRKDKDGNFIYIQVDTWKLRYMLFKPNTNWLAAPRPQWKNRRPPTILGGAMWAGPEYDSNDRGPEFDAQPVAEGKGDDHDGENGFPSLNDEELRLAESPEYQAELRRDQKAKLQAFAETPNFYSPYFIYCWWPHIMAGTTLVHWLSFMTGNCTQLTNTNMYLTQPVNGTPGSNYSFLNAVLLAWLMGLAYFLLSASAGTICTLQLNPANDIGARICHWLLPIPNKGYSGWSYAWVPIFFPFMGASVGAAIMYMSMFAKLSFPFLPYGSMRHWW